MPDSTPQSESKVFEVPIEVALNSLDKSYLGYHTVDNLGYRGPGRPPLISASVEITEAVLETIHTHAAHLGEDGEALTHIRLKRRQQTVAPAVREMLPKAKRTLIFHGLEASVESVRKQFQTLAPDHEQAVATSPERAAEILSKTKLQMEPDFAAGIEEALAEILEHKDEATLFACLDRYDESTCEHGLRVFLAGMKLLGKLMGLTPGKIQKNRRAMNYACGLLYLDVGLLFVPRKLLHRHMRIEMDEFIAIGEKFKRFNLDDKLLKIIYLVNDPQRVFSAHDEKLLTRQIESMSHLVEKGALTSEQYESLRQFPGWSCLTPAEHAILEKHAVWGYDLVKSSNFSSLQALDLIRHHHERIDQSGYPDRLRDMSEEAQVAATVDVFDALVSERPHKSAKPYDQAFDAIERMTRADEGRPARLGRKMYDLLCACIQKYPVGSFVRIEGGRYDGCVGQVREYLAGEHTMDKPEFILFRDKDGKRMRNTLLFKRKHYDGTFRVRGLPHTAGCAREMLAQE